MNDDLHETLNNGLDPESIDPMPPTALRGDDMLSEGDEGSELYEHIRMTVDAGQQPERIDTYLTNHLSNISRNRVQNAAKAGNILVNGKAVKKVEYKGRWKFWQHTDVGKLPGIKGYVDFNIYNGSFYDLRKMTIGAREQIGEEAYND